MRKVFALAALVLTVGCTTVEEYEVAVARTRVSGNIHDQVYGQGLHSTVGKRLYKYPLLREVQYPESEDSEIVSVLTSDQLQVSLEVAYMWRVADAACVRDLFTDVGPREAVEELVHKTYREATRDAVAELEAAALLSEGRQGIGARIRDLMNADLTDRCVTVTDFFIRDVEPPAAIKSAIEEKLAKEQEVQRQAYETQVVREQANQRREEAAGIRDAQAIIAESLVGPAGQRYLYWRALEMMEGVGEGAGNLVIVPTENGAPLFLGAPVAR